jgi:succinate dehydrogenase / fumarate reductase, membrane anchor subunit
MAAHTTVREVKTKATYESVAWKWMRYSAILLIPLVWGHVLIQDIIVGVHNMGLGYVAERWASIFWRIYDALLLGFTFAHGVNGLRQVLIDYIHGAQARKILNWALFIFWLAIFLFGFVALIAGVNQSVPVQ